MARGQSMKLRYKRVDFLELSQYKPEAVLLQMP